MAIDMAHGRKPIAGGQAWGWPWRSSQQPSKKGFALRRIHDSSPIKTWGCESLNPLSILSHFWICLCHPPHPPHPPHPTPSIPSTPKRPSRCHIHIIHLQRRLRLHLWPQIRQQRLAPWIFPDGRWGHAQIQTQTEQSMAPAGADGSIGHDVAVAVPAHGGPWRGIAMRRWEIWEGCFSLFLMKWSNIFRKITIITVTSAKWSKAKKTWAAQANGSWLQMIWQLQLTCGQWMWNKMWINVQGHRDEPAKSCEKKTATPTLTKAREMGNSYTPNMIHNYDGIRQR